MLPRSMSIATSRYPDRRPRGFYKRKGKEVGKMENMTAGHDPGEMGPAGEGSGERLKLVVFQIHFEGRGGGGRTQIG